MISYICNSCYEREAEEEDGVCVVCWGPDIREGDPESIGELAVEQWVVDGGNL